MKHLNHRARRLIHRLTDLILPPRCPITGVLVGQNGTLDPRFWAELNFIHDSFCDVCGAPFRQAMAPGMVCGACLAEPPLFDRARAVLRYDDASTRMILKFKHADGTQLAPLFGHWLLQYGAALLAQSDVIIPVPLHRWRLLKRRYNQAALLTAYLAKHSGIANAPHVLRRARHTESQGRKTKNERHENLQQAFMVPEKLRPQIAGKRVLLIDDVLTSGATVNECTKTLLKAGAQAVNVLTIARVGFAS